MLKENLMELFDAVGYIQEEIYDTSSEDYHIKIIANGYVGIVEFLDIVIWSSEDDGRKFNDKKNEYESFEKFLRRRIRKELKKIKKIKV